MAKRIFVEAVYVLLVVLFAYTATAKLMNIFDFRGQLMGHSLIGHKAKYLVYAIPIAELVTVLLLLIPSTRIKGLYVSLGLLVVFSIYILLMLLLGDNLPCTCGGVLQELTWTQHIFFNGGFIAITIFAIVEERRRRNHQGDRVTLST